MKRGRGPHGRTRSCDVRERTTPSSRVDLKNEGGRREVKVEVYYQAL